MNITEITSVRQQIAERLRLAPYCRVSSDSTDQLHSFAAQIRYYSDYAKKHPEYQLVDIYADEGITGTEMKKRDELNRLIADCRKGKVDRIIVKSVSRLARNTEELLVLLRMCKEIGVSVYFEEQGIDTEKLNMEMIVTFPGMAAQQESVNISGNLRWSYQKRMQSGDFNCTCPAYGFDLKDGELVINETEAAVIRRIFDLYLQGYGTLAIAKMLNEDGIPRKHGYEKWLPSSINYVLNNERYMGDALLQKSYTTETLPFRKMKNDGRLPQYYVENSKVVFRYKNFLGYRKGEDGQPEIVPEEAETIRLIYDRFLAGDSLKGIAKLLEEKGIKSPTGKAEWQFSTIQSILSNERYKGDAIINKTYITDCISKKVRVNNGERPKYYVENSHPAIIDSSTFGRVQEELARRSGKRKISRKAKTEQGKYSSKYALTELLVCGECKSAYRRCTWTASGKKKIVWRCINRLDFGKKYCRNSPTVEESVLQRAVMAAIMETANQNTEVLRTLKLHIGMGLAGEKSEDNSIDLQIRIAEIDAEFKKMLDRVSTDTIEAFDEETATRLMNEKSRLQQQLDNIADAEQRRENAKSRLDDIYMILDGIKNRPMEYDDQIVRQLLECIVVDSKEQITVIFKGGLKSVQLLNE